MVGPVNASDSSYAGLTTRTKGYAGDFREILDWMDISEPAETAVNGGCFQ